MSQFIHNMIKTLQKEYEGEPNMSFHTNVRYLIDDSGLIVHDEKGRPILYEDIGDGMGLVRIRID
jgi:hypothetical protein